MFPTLAGYDLINNYNVTFYVNVYYAGSGLIWLEFNVENDLQIYSMSFYVIGSSINSHNFFILERYGRYLDI